MPNPVDDAPLGRGEIALPTDPDIPHPNDAARLRKFRRRVVYIAAVLFTVTALVLWEHSPNIRRPADELSVEGPWPTGIADDPRLERYQTPDDAEYCAEWVEGDEPHQASASFELPMDADLLFFLSRGPVFGEINIKENPSRSNRPVEVNVTANYRGGSGLKHTKACRMAVDNEHGVFLWAGPRHPHGDPERDVRLNITVSVTKDVSYGDLTTDLPLFSHNVGDFFHLWTATYFDSIRLKTFNAAIDFGSMVGRAAYIQTSNAPVKGFFGGGDLALQTSNAPINAVGIMWGDRAGYESRVSLKTSNGAVEAALAVVSDYSDSVLRADVHTSAGLIKITTRLDYSTNASLVLDASTSIEPAEVRLDAWYEGTYDLQTSLEHASVEQNPGTDDPLGKGRQRTVTKTREGQQAQGSIYWSDDGEPTEETKWGSVKVSTTLSPVFLLV
ncbi:hypothetical protein GGX14DRAFT_698894 [Mycena pura]|uniref:Uncharacterized protein n=1 Tax=Mycena pura TaxID=153505 RepID=A0AAD6V6B5_9AGAR|nr:hypothetical protein GGX14DRAFT_698894 [Mycena pura]